jgi:putative sterol carrier protein
MSALRVDVKAARSALERQLARAPAQLAEGFARVVGSSTDARLEQILRTPVRRAVLEGIFWQMPQHLDRRAATAMDATIRWRITSGRDDQVDTYELQIKDGRSRTRRGESGADPDVTITVDAAEFVLLATGNSDPMQAYFKGRVKLAGDLMVAARLSGLFRIPGLARRRQRNSTVSSSR